MGAKVAILMGSDSDWPVLQKTAETLKSFDVAFEAHVMSAHRTPDRAAEFSKNAEANGLRVIICAAGVAAHLAGVISAHTILPVIGIPMPSGDLKGMDALLSTVQMPGGIPVATVAIGSGGAVNAALLAVEILALSDPDLRVKMHKHKTTMAEKVMKADAELQKSL